MIPEIAPEPLPETKPEIIPEVIPEVKPRTRWQRFLHWEFLGLFLIVLTTLVFHIIAIDRPRHRLG